MLETVPRSCWVASAFPSWHWSTPPALKHASPRQAGLYHTAVLFDTKADLAAAVLSTARHATGSFTGSADHRVSNAFYFNDAEGNGVELYWDDALAPNGTTSTASPTSAEILSTPTPSCRTISANQRSRAASGVRRKSDMCTCRSAMFRPPDTSTRTSSASRLWATWGRHSSSARVGTTTTWP